MYMFDNCLFFFFKQKTAYEMRISDWSSDVCSSDLLTRIPGFGRPRRTWARCPIWGSAPCRQSFQVHERSEERRVGKSVSVRVDLGGRRIIKKKTNHPQYSTSM